MNSIAEAIFFLSFDFQNMFTQWENYQRFFLLNIAMLSVGKFNCIPERCFQ